MVDDAPHSHPSPWPFAEPADLRINTTRQVLEGAPILLVTRTQKGHWVLHCGTTKDLSDKRGACFGCMVEKHPELLALADLELGEKAGRPDASSPWERANPNNNKKVLGDAVASSGWMTVLMPPDRPLWAFTVGLGRTFGHPELCVLGLPGPIMFQMLEGLANEVKGGETFAPGSRTDRLLEGRTCELRGVHARWRDLLLGPMFDFYEGAPFEVLQCLWPDKDGKLPGEPGYAEGYRNRQPELEHEDAEEAGMAALLAALRGG